jgi:hypothetical protein
MLNIIKHTYGLNFKDVQEYLPQLTIHNEVVTSGAILHLEIMYNQQRLNLFIDTHTQQYCFNAADENVNDVMYEIGDIALAKYRHYKNNREALISYILKNLTSL